MFVMIDNYDSFVYNLLHYMEELGEEVTVFRNDRVTIEEIKEISPLGILISPGPKSPAEAGICEEIVACFGSTIPILGVCLGHQLIAYHHGARVVKGKRPMHGKLSQVFHHQQGVFRGLPSPIVATRYHSLVVEEATLPEEFIVTAKSDDGEIMGLRHKSLLLEGVQFHPEAVLTEYGHELLGNFISWCKEASHGANNQGDSFRPGRISNL